jgi:hypothetical protein
MDVCPFVAFFYIEDDFKLGLGGGVMGVETFPRAHICSEKSNVKNPFLNNLFTHKSGGKKRCMKKP